MKGKRYLPYLLVVLIIVNNPVYPQQNPANGIEEIHTSQLEDLSETTDSESEDDHIQQQLSYFLRQPLNINGDRETLTEFPLFDDLMINHLLAYRKLLGNLISVHELQAVPGFSLEEIKSMLPYITVANHSLSYISILKRFTGRDHSLIVRPTLVPEIMNGFLKNQPANQSFIGSRPALFIRYKYQYDDLLKFSFLIDKDAGEKFFSGSKISLPDFYSFNFTINKAGIIQSLIIGDYSINLGQGLMHWQSQAFKKSAGVITIKRQSSTLRPYHSAGEYNFMRGFATTLRSGNLETTLFASARKLSANIGLDSTYGPSITSIITSGLHRTPSELADRSTAGLMAVGGSFKHSGRMGHTALNAIGYQYSLPLLKRNEAYNHYTIKGKRWFNCSFDYSFTYRNLHFFGEMAFDKKGSHAIINGMMASLHSLIDLSILHRAIASSYQSLFGNAFTENTLPTNEHGIYNGISIRPHHHWRIDLYADLFSFPVAEIQGRCPIKRLSVSFSVYMETWKKARSIQQVQVPDEIFECGG